MSGDYVSRDYLLGEYDRQHQGPPGGARKIIAEAPAADVVEVRHGKWERTKGNPYPSCSECGIESLSRADRPYCQFCGAKMDGKSADYAPAAPYDLLYEEGGPDA